MCGLDLWVGEQIKQPSKITQQKQIQVHSVPLRQDGSPLSETLSMHISPVPKPHSPIQLHAKATSTATATTAAMYSPRWTIYFGHQFWVKSFEGLREAQSL
jgi:hypothetical protein